MVSSTLCPAVHILGSQNVYGRAEDIADHYWPWVVFFQLKQEEAKQSMSWIIPSCNHSIKYDDALLTSPTEPKLVTELVTKLVPGGPTGGGTDRNSPLCCPA